MRLGKIRMREEGQPEESNRRAGERRVCKSCKTERKGGGGREADAAAGLLTKICQNVRQNVIF
jgi:hypothetical protein